MAEFPSHMLVYTRSCSETGTCGIYCFPLRDQQFPTNDLAALIVLLLQQNHMKIAVQWTGQIW